MNRSRVVLVVLGLSLGGCGISLGSLFEERPAHPLDRFTVTSDARLDSTGGIRGSFVGEGTSRAVHLVSTDTAFIAALARRQRPDLGQGGTLWSSLARAGTVVLDPATLTPPGGRYRPMVGSPEGRTDVQVTGALIRAGTCGWRGTQAELIVSGPGGGREVPGLRGPVVASFRLDGEVEGRRLRRPPPLPSNALIDTLLSRTRLALDSLLFTGERGERLRSLAPEQVPLNSLLDIDAADLIPFAASGSQVRYAVSLRERRLTARGDTAVAAIVMVWDSSGAWQQTMLGPTLLTLRQGRLLPRSGYIPLFWRRLQAVNGFEYDRDYLWMEQVSPSDGSVLWGIIDPHGNVPVAAAEMAGPCSYVGGY